MRSIFLRRYLVVFGLIVTLLVLIGIHQIIANWRYVLSGEVGELLYAATFDGFVDEWEQYQGRLEAQVVDDVMRLDVDMPQRSPYSAALPNFADFDLRVEARSISGPLDNSFGVVFRLRDSDTQYRFLISSDGWYRITRKVNGVEKVLSNWISSPLIQQGIGVTNWLRVVASGDTFRFYINGEQVQLCVPNDPVGESTYYNGECIGGRMVDALVDDAIGVGQVGVVAQTLNEPGVVVDFDNLLVFGVESAGE